MSSFFDIAFTPSVTDLQRQKGSRQNYEQASAEWATHDILDRDAIDFVTARDSMYVASTGSTGWPYVQHRGGDAGFVTALDDRTIGWVERPGNRQYISLGNLAANDRVAIIMVDYPNRRRLKLYGHATYHATPNVELIERLRGTGLRNDGAIVVEVVAVDWNCPKYIVPRFAAEDMRPVIEARDKRIAELESELERLGVVAS